MDYYHTHKSSWFCRCFTYCSWRSQTTDSVQKRSGGCTQTISNIEPCLRAEVPQSARHVHPTGASDTRCLRPFTRTSSGHRTLHPSPWTGPALCPAVLGLQRREVAVTARRQANLQTLQVPGPTNTHHLFLAGLELMWGWKIEMSTPKALKKVCCCPLLS